MKKYFHIAVLTLMILIPVVSVFAAPTPTTTPPGSQIATGTDTLYNPLPENNLTKMFLTLAKGFLAIIGVWAIIFIIVGGFHMITANGNEEQLTAAKKTVTWAIIGALVAIMSFSIIAIVQNFLPVDQIQIVPTSNN